jgi:chromosome partitioning protein
MSKRLVVFNHKGGVSKTTSVYNLGWMLARSAKVLLVDADSQCNLSSLILGDDFERYYIDSPTSLQNIKDGVAVAFKGKPSPITAVNCFSPQRAPSLFLLAGHADLTEHEASLSLAQMSSNAFSALQNLPGAFNELIRLTEEKYSIDYTIIDLNPSLSSINQNLFLACDAFLVPANPDPFSMMALNTLQTTLPRWVDWKQANEPLFADSAYPLRDCTPKLCGSIIQRFNIRNGKAARPYRDNIEEIKDRLSTDFFQTLALKGMTFPAAIYSPELIKQKYCMAEIPDFQGLLPKAHAAGVPVFDLTDQEIHETGPVLEGMQKKRTMFTAQFIDLAKEVEYFLKHA